MAKKPEIPKTKNLRVAPDEIELLPDAWGIFEKAVDRVAKSPPQHRTATKTDERHSSTAAKTKPAKKR